MTSRPGICSFLKIGALFLGLWILQSIWSITPVHAQLADNQDPFALEKEVYFIGKTLSNTTSAKNLFVVTNAFTNMLGTSSVGRGIHYTITITKFPEEVGSNDLIMVSSAVAVLLQETTERVLTKNADMAYVAVLFIHPSLWPQGFAGNRQGYAYLYVAKRDELLALHETQIEGLDWLKAAKKGSMQLVDSTILQDLMESYSKKERNKGF